MYRINDTEFFIGSFYDMNSYYIIINIIIIMINYHFIIIYINFRIVIFILQ